MTNEREKNEREEIFERGNATTNGMWLKLKFDKRQIVKKKKKKKYIYI